jgi:hypothetical protein
VKIHKLYQPNNLNNITSDTKKSNSMNIYRLITENTIEEELLERITKKASLDQIIVQRQKPGYIFIFHSLRMPSHVS